MGRPSSYTKKKGDAICLRLAQGDSLAAICDDTVMPSLEGVRRWKAANEGFRADYARARDEQAEHYFDSMLAAAQSTPLDGNAIAKQRLVIDTMKWVLGRMKPKKYGDRIDVTSGGEPLQPIRVEIINKQSEAADD